MTSAFKYCQCITLGVSDKNHVLLSAGDLVTMSGRYKGSLEAGIKSGVGTMTFKNGQRYEGNWVNGRFNGKGEEKHCAMSVV